MEKNQGGKHDLNAKIIRIAMLMLLLIVVNSAVAQPSKAKLDQFFDRLAEKDKAMGSFTMVKDGNTVYTRTIGYSEINGMEKKPLTAMSRFRIGSITKLFTAAMILQLAEEGKLRLSDTLDKFFPHIPNARKITILQILGHRSGIPNIKREQNAQENVNTLPITKDEMLRLIAKAKPDFEPGTKYAYSNSGYQLLGLILEKITGKTYGEVLEKRITSRIGLKDTYLATGSIDVNKNEALTYMNFNGDWKQLPETHPSILFSAGGIVSTTNDLVKFIQLLFEGKIVSNENLFQMKTMMEPFSYAGRTFFGHTGGADNYGAWLAYMPEDKLAFAYTTNAKIYPVGEIVNGLMDIYYDQPFQIPSFEVLVLSPEILDKYVGMYSTTEAPVKFTISRKGGTLFIQPNSESAAALEATAEDKFKIEGAIVVEFEAAKNQMIIKRKGAQRVFTKMIEH